MGLFPRRCPEDLRRSMAISDGLDDFVSIRVMDLGVARNLPLIDWRLLSLSK